jgi:hypothetical protein
MTVRTLRALVVEDDPLDLAIIERLAARIEGDVRLETVPCADPKAALEAVRSGFDVVLLDHYLGAADGLEVLAALRAAGDETPVVFVTGAEDVHVASRAIQAGAFDYLLKNELTPDALRHAALGAVRSREADAERRVLARRIQTLERMDAAALVAAGIAHDFSNMLTGIAVWAGLALESAAEGGDAEPLRQIISLSERAGALVRTLVDATHPADGRFPPASLGGAARAAVDALRAEARPGIRVDLEPPPEGDLVVEGEPARLETAIRNLVANAGDAMPSGGRVAVRFRREERDPAVGAGIARPPAMALLEVEDEGRGIRPEIRERIFDAYFTTKDEPSRKGLGLGLALALAIARAHRGTLDFESAPGRTVFRLRIPLARADAAGAKRADPAPGAAPPAPGARVLLVEDDAVSRRIALAILERAGHRVEVAPDGESALALFRAGPYDLVVMDSSLPGIDGCEATREIRRIEGEARRTPVLGLSGGDSAEERDRALASGMDGYQRKPIDPSAFTDAVAVCLSSARRAPDAAPSPGGPSPAGPGAPTERGDVLDPAALARLRILGERDPGFVRRLIDLFEASTPSRLATLRGACEAGEGAAIAAAAHPLKSNLRQLGALKAADLAWRLEAAGRSGALRDAPALLESLEEALARLAPALALERGAGPSGG